MFKLKRSFGTIVAISAGACGFAAASYASEQATAAPNPAIFSGVAMFSSGGTSTSVLMGTVPTGKYLVVQTVTFYRTQAASGSSTNAYLYTTINGKSAYLAVPEAVADGTPFPGATLSATFYAAPKSAISVNLYRSGDTSSTESDYVTVVGYFIDGAPSD